MTLTKSQKALRAAGALGALAAMTTAAPVSAAPTQLETGKTFHATETFSVADGDKLTPYCNIEAYISKPGSLWIQMTPAAADKKSSFFVTSGQEGHEYSGSNNMYKVIDAAKPGEIPGSGLVNMADVGDVLTPSTSAPTGVTRTYGKDAIDGAAMVLRTDVRSIPAAGDRPATTITEKLWSDADTGLPRRRSAYIQRGTEAQKEIQQIDFTKWTVDGPIPATQFAWAPPAGAKLYEEPKLLAAGVAAPDFTATTPDGKSVKLSDYKGKIVVLDFWATWCSPCQASMPHVEKVYKQVKDKDVVVLGVCVWDKKTEYDKWVVAKKGTYSFPTAFDPAGQGDNSIAGKLYNVTGIPTQYIIDKDGKVAASTVGYEDGDHQLEDALIKLGVNVKVEAKTASAK